MTNAVSNAGTPVPAMDFSAYSKVTIVTTGEVEGHPFRRGETHMVNNEIFEALKAAKMIDTAKSK